MSTTTPTLTSLSRRELAMLQAIAAGRAETTGSREPDLFIDGLACCDQNAAHHTANRWSRPEEDPEEVRCAASSPHQLI